MAPGQLVQAPTSGPLHDLLVQDLLIADEERLEAETLGNKQDLDARELAESEGDYTIIHATLR